MSLGSSVLCGVGAAAAATGAARDPQRQAGALGTHRTHGRASRSVEFTRILLYHPNVLHLERGARKEPETERNLSGKR